jgi:AraC-like DNA-binding protein
MPSSAVRTFTDADEYAAAIRGGTLELTVTGRGRLAAKLTRIDLHRLWMQRLSENLPRVYHLDGWGGRAIALFRSDPGPSVWHGGVDLQPGNFARLSAGQSYYQHSSGSASICSMSLQIEDMAAVGAAMAGSDLRPPRDTLILSPPPAAMARLRRLHAAATHLAEEAPELIANPDAAYGLEQALIQAMVGCLDTGAAREDSVAQRQHELIMRRFRRVLEENPGQPLYIPEICKIGVSERTLRVCCQEQLGMAPKRFLLLRRMHQAERALREGSPGATTVTEIATRYGFWELGRFSVEYRSQFGEPPSATLRRQAGHRQDPSAEFA